MAGYLYLTLCVGEGSGNQAIEDFSFGPEQPEDGEADGGAVSRSYDAPPIQDASTSRSRLMQRRR